MPDTSVLSISKATFCEGDSAIVEVNDATNIRWKKDQQFISAVGSKLTVKASGNYKAFIKNIEGIEDSTRAIAINVTATPSAPLVENLAYCIGANTNTLSATATNSNNLLWYGTASTGGTATSTVIAPPSITAGQTDYYVSQKTLINACEGPRSKITVTINSKPSAPVVSNVVYCEGVTANSLTATSLTGNTLKWYATETSSAVLSAIPVPDTRTAGAIDYYVSQLNDATGCEGPRSKITTTINPKPSAPVVSNVVYCEGVAANSLNAISLTGNTLKWYLADTSSVPLTNTPIPNTNKFGIQNYYVSQANNVTSCESVKSKIIITINPTPLAPVVNNISYCVGATSGPVNAIALDGNTINWYLSDTTSIKLSTAPTPETKNVGSIAYYVSQKNNITGCEGVRSKLIANIYPIPSKPVISRLDSNRLTSNIIGSIWYLDTLQLTDTSSIIKPNTTGRYYVKSNQNGCISALSEQYYFLTTDIYMLNADEFIKFNPNPFNGQIKFDFYLKGISQINIELIQLTTGIKLFTKSNIKTGTVVNLPNMSSGIYVLSISSPDGKFNKQFKVVKL
jgi:hypothetical protein